MKLAVLVFLSLVVLTIMAQAKALKAHVHGSGTLDISIDKNVISAVLKAPAEDFVGFEGSPKTQKQKDTNNRIVKTMSQEYNLLLTDDAAECVGGKRSFNQEFTEHGDDTLKMEYTCKDISKVKTLDVNIFRDVETLKSLTVQLVTNKEQKEIKLNRTKTQIEL
jgi:hypothetical protein